MLKCEKSLESINHLRINPTGDFLATPLCVNQSNTFEFLYVVGHRRFDHVQFLPELADICC